MGSANGKPAREDIPLCLEIRLSKWWEVLLPGKNNFPPVEVDANSVASKFKFLEGSATAAAVVESTNFKKNIFSHFSISVLS